MSLIDDVSTRRRKGRPVHFSAQKLRQIQMTTKNKSLSSRLLAHMPIAGPKGRCEYCSIKAHPIFSNVKCSFCGISLRVEQHKICFFSVSCKHCITFAINKLQRVLVDD